MQRKLSVFFFFFFNVYSINSHWFYCDTPTSYSGFIFLPLVWKSIDTEGTENCVWMKVEDAGVGQWRPSGCCKAFPAPQCCLTFSSWSPSSIFIYKMYCSASLGSTNYFKLKMISAVEFVSSSAEYDISVFLLLWDNICLNHLARGYKLKLELKFHALKTLLIGPVLSLT